MGRSARTSSFLAGGRQGHFVRSEVRTLAGRTPRLSPLLSGLEAVASTAAEESIG